MNAVNYDAVMQRMLAASEGKSLLLHACCAPCASYCLTETAPRVRVTAFFYNPNLDSAEEYEKRLEELRRLTAQTGWAQVMECGYRSGDFAAVSARFFSKKTEDEKEFYSLFCAAEARYKADGGSFFAAMKKGTEGVRIYDLFSGYAFAVKGEEEVFLSECHE